MRSARKLSFVLLTLLCTSGLSAAVVHAEGAPYTGDETDTPKPKPVVKRKKPAAKPAPVVTTPAAPVPYLAGSGTLSPDMAKALTPAPLAPLPPPVAIAPAPVTMQPVTMQPINDPPPPPPADMPIVTSRPLPAPNQINLKCETQVTEGKRFVSQGTFYIDLFPSPVFPDEQADFKFLRVDPAHQSLIRQSICLDTGCSANVTGAAYYLVNRSTKHGSALRITLDRSNGAFYAEEIDDKRIGKDSHRGETGYCAPQALPTKLF